MINDEPILFGKIFIAGKTTQVIQKITTPTLTEESIPTQPEETKTPIESEKIS